MCLNNDDLSSIYKKYNEFLNITDFKKRKKNP